MATGGGNSNRTCNVELDGSDSARNEERASTFPAGSTITLKFEEYIGHTGRYRVAFDPEGADFDDFNANVIHDETDPAGSQGNIGDGTKWEIEVTLPNTPCDNCTLQLLQVMAGGAENPVDASKLASLSTYYTCIDLTLTAPEGDTTSEASDTSSPMESSSDTETGELASSDEGSASSDVTSVDTTPTDVGTTQSDAASSSDTTSLTSSAPTSTALSTTAAVTSTPTSSVTTTTAATTSVGDTAPQGNATEVAPNDGEPGDTDSDAGGGCNVAPLERGYSFGVAFGAMIFGALVARRRRSA